MQNHRPGFEGESAEKKHSDLSGASGHFSLPMLYVSVFCRTCREAAPTRDRRAVRTPTPPPGWWWRRWRGATDASNTPRTEGTTTTPPKPARDGRRVLVRRPVCLERRQRSGAEVAPTCLLSGMLLASFWTASWLLKSLFFGAQQSLQTTAVAVRMTMMKKPRQ